MALAIRRATPADAPTLVEFNRLLALESEGKILDDHSFNLAGACRMEPHELFDGAQAGMLPGQLNGIRLRDTFAGTVQRLEPESCNDRNHRKHQS